MGWKTVMNSESNLFSHSSNDCEQLESEPGEKIGQALGEEAASMDVNILLGPGLNIKRSPLCGRNFEYFSEDPYLSGKMAASYIRGIQSKGVFALIASYMIIRKKYHIDENEYERLIK